MCKKEILNGMFDRHEYNVNGTSPNGNNNAKQPIDPNNNSIDLHMCKFLFKFINMFYFYF